MRESNGSKTWWVRCGCRSNDVRALALLVCLLGAALLAGCSPHGRAALRPGRAEWVAVASWYGAKFHGRRTSSGEIYDMNGLSAAHRTLPFGTRLRVTHPRTRRSVVVQVNDRGPFIRGRDLDLSYGAARALDMVHEGVARVHVQRLR